MYLYVGEDLLILKNKILYIADWTEKFYKDNRDFFEKKRLINLSVSPVKSLIGSSDGILYCSPIDARTLKKRMKNI